MLAWTKLKMLKNVSKIVDLKIDLLFLGVCILVYVFNCFLTVFHCVTMPTMPQLQCPPNAPPLPLWHPCFKSTRNHLFPQASVDKVKNFAQFFEICFLQKCCRQGCWGPPWGENVGLHCLARSDCSDLEIWTKMCDCISIQILIKTGHLRSRRPLTH